MKKYYIVIADVHGDIDQLVPALNRSRDFLRDRFNSEGQVVFLGDLIDRTPNENQVMKVVKKEVEDGAVLLIGNHDYFLFGTANGDPKQALLWDENGGEATCLRMFGPPGEIPDKGVFREYCRVKGYDTLLTAYKEQHTTLRWANIIKESWQYKLLAEHAHSYHETEHIFFCHAPQTNAKQELSMWNLLWGTDSSYYHSPDTMLKVPKGKRMSVHGHFHRLEAGLKFPRLVNYMHGGIMKTVVLADSGCGCGDSDDRGELHPVIIEEGPKRAHVVGIL